MRRNEQITGKIFVRYSSTVREFYSSTLLGYNTLLLLAFNTRLQYSEYEYEYEYSSTL
jgi:hypothetical protein